MIELVSQSRCTHCNLCVSACPDNVFDAVPGAPPVVARKQDCQTCFLCELFCPADALYVSPFSEAAETVDEESLIASGLLGSFRRQMGWENARPRGTDRDLSYRMFEDGLITP